MREDSIHTDLYTQIIVMTTLLPKVAGHAIVHYILWRQHEHVKNWHISFLVYPRKSPPFGSGLRIIAYSCSSRTKGENQEVFIFLQTFHSYEAMSYYLKLDSFKFISTVQFQADT